MHAVAFREPLHEVTEFTDHGTGIRRRPPRGRWPEVYRQLADGPFLAAFDAGLYDLRDAAPRGAERVRLTGWRF